VNLKADKVLSLEMPDTLNFMAPLADDRSLQETRAWGYTIHSFGYSNETSCFIDHLGERACAYPKSDSAARAFGGKRFLVSQTRFGSFMPRSITA